MYFKSHFLLHLSLSNVMYANMSNMTAYIKSIANTWHLFKTPEKTFCQKFSIQFLLAVCYVPIFCRQTRVN